VRAAEVALGQLDERTRALAERRLAEDPAFRAEVDRLRATADALAGLESSAWRPEAPPPLDDDRAMTLRPPQPVRPRRRARRLVPVVAGVAAAAVALVLVLSGGADERRLRLRALAGVPGEATLRIAGNEAELSGHGMPPSGPDDYYEAWLADARGRMVSMGTFRVGRDGAVDVHMAVAVDVSRYRFVDVSLEPNDGDPAHSDRSVMRAPI
jgi:anti-sigma-K factor RskA